MFSLAINAILLNRLNEPSAGSVPAVTLHKPYGWLSIQSPASNQSVFRVVSGRIVEIKNPYDPFSTSTQLVGADPSTFQVWSNWNDDIGMDRAHVYGGGKVIAGADPDTFVPLAGPGDGNELYAIDVHYVFRNFFDGWGVVAHADPSTFVVLPTYEACYMRNCHFDAADRNNLFDAGAVANCAPAS